MNFRILLQALLLASSDALAWRTRSSGNAMARVERRVAGSCITNGTRLPEQAWDSHHHVMDPPHFPPLPNAEYTPGVYTVWDNAIFEQRIGCERVTMVQPSFYGNDNTLMIASLIAYGPDRAAAVVVFDVTNITAEQLHEWDQLGVRGVRLNFQTTDTRPDVAFLERTLRQYADLVKQFDWVIELYIAMDQIPGIQDTISSLGVRVAFDHMGSPAMPEPAQSPQDFTPYSIKGFGSMVRLLEQGVVYVKISGAYRLSKLPGPDYTDLDPLIDELFLVAPKRLVYGSDWPHTRFDGLDIKPWTDHLLDLALEKEGLAQRLFSDNARELWSRRNCTRPDVK